MGRCFGDHAMLVMSPASQPVVNILVLKMVNMTNHLLQSSERLPWIKAERVV